MQFDTSLPTQTPTFSFRHDRNLVIYDAILHPKAANSLNFLEFLLRRFDLICNLIYTRKEKIESISVVGSALIILIIIFVL